MIRQTDGLNNTTRSLIDIVSSVEKQYAEIIKRLSSIEMELLIARGACLDNNFEGKTEM